MIDFEIFTQQAEYIPGESFSKWTVTHNDELQIIKKLTQGGAKIIVGPRGCGKTTLMKKAYNSLINANSNSSLPVYVNFKSSLKLEPLYRSNTNAAFWFNQWLLFKVYLGLLESAKAFKIEQDIDNKISTIEEIVNNLEMARIDLFENSDKHLSLSKLEHHISQILTDTKRTRCVLLLDDAGHAFSDEQQHDFFEFFREIKTKSISPKAAVYPGVTSYSSAFHIGHDAEEIDVWLKPSSNGYLDFMYEILESRLGKEIFNKIKSEKTVLDFLCFSAYGIPRALLNMVSSFFKEEEENITDGKINLSKIKFDSNIALKAVRENYENNLKIYESLKIKLPLYKNFIDTGSTAFEEIQKIIKDFNKKNKVESQSSSIAIQRPISPEFSKVLGFFQYSGLLAPRGTTNRGNKGVYEIYELHYGAIVDRNIFFSSRGLSLENYCLAFNNRPNHLYPRHKETGLIGNNDPSKLFTLALPPCEVCRTKRLSNEARFCVNCGIKLKDFSVFENIVSQDIEKLPITLNRAKSIKSSSKIKTIKDILMDYDNKELRSVPMVGPHWAKTIKSYAEEFIA